MKTHVLLAAILSSLVCFFAAPAQEKSAAAPAAGQAPGSGAGVTELSQDELEAGFKALLSKATLSGRWCSVDNGQLGPEKKGDSYSIASASKTGGHQWVIHARMRYGEREMVLPVPVQVKWSGDTPVLIVNDLSTGGERRYSARVLFFGNTYAGTWSSSGGQGGLLYGTITHDPQPSEPAAASGHPSKP